jgi:hypothetical protein
MENQTIKKGMIKDISADRITFFNSDGLCEDTFPIYAWFANDIRENVHVGNTVLYVVQGDQLVTLGLEEMVPFDLKMLYELMPKDINCSKEEGGFSA